MAKTVIWNKQAFRAFRNIATYLRNEFSAKTADKFIDATYNQIDALLKYPTKGRRAMSTKTIRFINIDEHRQMFYRVKGSNLYIAHFFDTRQNPNKRPY